MKNELDEMIAKYFGNDDTLRGSPITKQNYEDIINLLHYREEKSFGMLKSREVVRFLQEWFE